MWIRIEADALPGRDFPLACATGADGGALTYRNIHVAVQRRGKPDELLDPQPGDAASAGWRLDCATKAGPDGIDVTGPYVQGRPGERFVYLNWGAVDDTGGFAMFRRAKLMLDAVPAEILVVAAEQGVLVGRLGLSDRYGAPLCARVVPPTITWSSSYPEPVEGQA